MMALPSAMAQTPAQAPGAPPIDMRVAMGPPADAPPIKSPPPGPYKVDVLSEPSLTTHTVYRPTNLSSFTGKNRLPIVAWGNGGCSNAGLAFQTFLTQIASHGFMIIVSGPKDAPLPDFSRMPPPGPPGAAPSGPPAGLPMPMTKDADLLTAVDWAIKETGRKDSPYFGKLDPDKVAVMGQSCGGLQATAVSGDPRVKTTVIWNSGTFPPGGMPMNMSGATKDSIKTFHAPVAYFLGGSTDIAYPNGKDDFSLIPAPGVPAFLGSIKVGHGGTYAQPGGGRFGEVGVAWLKWRLNGDKASAKFFEGADCTLCKDPIWEVAKKNMK
jgi:hypothetical protein